MLAYLFGVVTATDIFESRLPYDSYFEKLKF